jgi:hypothetical protein
MRRAQCSRDADQQDELPAVGERSADRGAVLATPQRVHEELFQASFNP